MRNDIERLIKENKVNTFGFKSSIKRLESILSSEEKVLYLVSGNATMNPSSKMEVDILSIKDKEPVIMALTDQRIILIFKILMSEKIEQFPNREIREHRLIRNGLIGSKLRIATITRVFDIDLSFKKDSADRIEQVLQEIERTSNVTVPSENKERVDAIEQIEKLSKLRDAGILSEEEFKIKKEELLKRI